MASLTHALTDSTRPLATASSAAAMSSASTDARTRCFLLTSLGYDSTTVVAKLAPVVASRPFISALLHSSRRVVRTPSNDGFARTKAADAMRPGDPIPKATRTVPPGRVTHSQVVQPMPKPVLNVLPSTISSRSALPGCHSKGLNVRLMLIIRCNPGECAARRIHSNRKVRTTMLNGDGGSNICASVGYPGPSPGPPKASTTVPPGRSCSVASHAVREYPTPVRNMIPLMSSPSTFARTFGPISSGALYGATYLARTTSSTEAVVSPLQSHTSIAGPPGGLSSARSE